MTSVREKWQAGVPSEISFWRSVFVGEQFPEYRQEMLKRIDPQTPVAPYIAGHLPRQIAIAETKILDVAAGPVSCVGWQIHGQFPQITAIDALAPQYRAILDEFRLRPPVYTQYCDAEDLTQIFAPDTFDLVHIRNALDHCYDAMRVFRNMLEVLKPGGTLIVCGYTDEAESGKYEGLHQWNIRVDDGQMIIWRPGERYAVNELFSSQLDAVQANQDDAARWTSVTLTKRQDRSPVHPFHVAGAIQS